MNDKVYLRPVFIYFHHHHSERILHASLIPNSYSKLFQKFVKMSCYIKLIRASHCFQGLLFNGLILILPHQHFPRALSQKGVCVSVCKTPLNLFFQDSHMVLFNWFQIYDCKVRHFIKKEGKPILAFSFCILQNCLHSLAVSYLKPHSV